MLAGFSPPGRNRAAEMLSAQAELFCLVYPHIHGKHGHIDGGRPIEDAGSESEQLYESRHTLRRQVRGRNSYTSLGPHWRWSAHRGGRFGVGTVIRVSDHIDGGRPIEDAGSESEQLYESRHTLRRQVRGRNSYTSLGPHWRWSAHRGGRLGVGTVIRISAHIDVGRPIEAAGSESEQLYESRPTLTVVGPPRMQAQSRNSYTSLGPHWRWSAHRGGRLGVGTVIRVSAHIDGGRPIEDAGSESEQLYESRPTLTVVGPSRRQVRSRNSYTSLGPHWRWSAHRGGRLRVGTVIRVSAHIDGGRPIEEAGSESEQLYESRPTLTVVGPSRRQAQSRNSYTSLGTHWRRSAHQGGRLRVGTVIRVSAHIDGGRPIKEAGSESEQLYGSRSTLTGGQGYVLINIDLP